MFIRAGVRAVKRVVEFVGIPIRALSPIRLYVTVLLDSTPPPIVSLEPLTMLLQTFFQTNNHVSFFYFYFYHVFVHGLLYIRVLKS